MTDFGRLRLGMVDGQIRTADVTDHRVLGAFLETPRERFVPEARRDLAYLDQRAPLGPDGRYMLEPMLLARLIQLADPQERDRVLVVGCGLGYSVALFAQLSKSVVGLESDAGLAASARERLAGAENVKIVEGPLAEGAAADGTFDLIFCDGVVDDGPRTLAGQLARDGRIVAPAGPARASKATVFRPYGASLAATVFFDAYGPALPGFEPASAFSF